VQLPNIGCEVERISGRRHVDGVTARSYTFSALVLRVTEIAEEIETGNLRAT